MREAAGTFLLVIGVALAAVSVLVGVDATSIGFLDDLAGGSLARWAIGATGMVLIAGGWDMAFGRRP